MGLQPGRYNFKVWRGGTINKRVTIYQDEAETQPLDLTGYHARLRIASPNPIILTDDAGITLGGPNGTVDIYVSDEDTLAFDWPKANYELIIIDPDGDAEPYIYGQITVQGI